MQLQTDSSTVSAGVSAQVIDVIPNITENPFYYTTLQNGVQPRNETASSQTLNSFGIGVAGRSEFSAFGVNGGRAFENDIQLDGLAIMGDGFNEASIIPNEEGIQEVRVINNNFTADYGHGQSCHGHHLKIRHQPVPRPSLLPDTERGPERKYLGKQPAGNSPARLQSE